MPCSFEVSYIPHLPCEKLWPLTLLWSVYIIYLEFFCMVAFTPFIYLIICLYKYVLMNKYFVIWVIIQLYNYIIYFVRSKYSSFEPWKLFQLSPVPLWHTLTKLFAFCALSYFLVLLTFWWVRYSRLILYMFRASFLELSISPRNPGFCFVLFLEIGIRNKHLGARCTYC